jgi:hypothetical protein
VFSLKPETPLICAVEQLASYLENLNVKIVIKVDSHDLVDVTHAFEMTAIKDRVSFFLCYHFPLIFILVKSTFILGCLQFSVIETFY